MQEPPKFKVGDRVKVKESHIPKTDFPDMWTNKTYTISEIGWDGTVYINHPRYPTWSKPVDTLELVDTIDYKDTYVRVCSEDEKKKALDFYKEKGNVSYGYGVTSNRCYVGRMKDNEEYCLLNIDYLTGTKDITEEVLGKKEEKIIEKHKEDYEKSKQHIEEKRKESKFDFYDWGKNFYNQYYSPQRQHKMIIDEIIPFNNLPTKKMSTLRNNLRDRFFKKEESKLADLIEEVEEGFEPVLDLFNWLDKITDKQEDLVKELDSAVEAKDKSAIKEAKKKLEEFKKETLEDKLFEQLITISKKLIK